MSLTLFKASRAMPLLDRCVSPSLQYCTDYTTAPNLSTRLYDGVANTSPRRCKTGALRSSLVPQLPKLFDASSSNPEQEPTLLTLPSGMKTELGPEPKTKTKPSLPPPPSCYEPQLRPSVEDICYVIAASLHQPAKLLTC